MTGSKKGKPRQLTDVPAIRLQNAPALAPVSIPPDTERPVVGITYLEVSSGDYSLKAMAKAADKQKGKRYIYKELAGFLEAARSCNTIQELVDAFVPQNGLKNKDEKSRKKLNEIQKKYHIDTSDMVHVHCKRKGSGPFVLHGFIIKNRFEIVWLDPDHEVHPGK